MRLALSIAACAFGIAATAAPAPTLSGEVPVTVPMAEVLRLARSNPVIKLQARLQVQRAKIAVDDVFCRASKLDPSWGRLSGTIVGPYRCVIGSHTLQVTANQRFTDASGARLSPLAADIKSKAVAVVEDRFRGRWSRTAVGAPR